MNRSEIPRTPGKIATRIGELGFTSAFQRELRSLIVARNAIAASGDSADRDQHLADLRIHLIEPGQPLHGWPDKAAFKKAIGFLTALREHGRACAEHRLEHPERHLVRGDSSLFETRGT